MGADAVLCVHETGATAEVWGPLANALKDRARVIGFDRPGWGRSPAPEGYARTTIGEQAAAAAAVAARHSDAPVAVCGAGLGAVVGLELVLRRPELAIGAVLVEPPLLAFVPEATEALAADAVSLREDAAAGGRPAVLARYSAGAYPALGPGAGRLPPELHPSGEHAVASLFAELGAVPGWELPTAELVAAPRPSLIVVGADTPPLLRAAADGLSGLLGRSELREVGAGLPHHDGASELADLLVELIESV